MTPRLPNHFDIPPSRADEFRLEEYDRQGAKVIAALQLARAAIRALAQIADEVRDDPQIGDMSASEWIDQLEMAAESGVKDLEDMR